MAFNPIGSIRNRFKRESRDAGAAVQQESEALGLEVEEEQEEAAVQSEVRTFSSGLLAEDKLVRDIGGLHNSKFTVLRAFQAASTATRNLSAAKKRLFGSLLSGGRRIATLTTRARVAVAGVSTISPGFQRDLQLWLAEQRKELQFLENEVALQIKENEGRAAKVTPVMEKNKEIREKLAEYARVLGKQNMQLSAIRTNLLKKISAEKRELELSREALQEEIDALRAQRGVPG